MAVNNQKLIRPHWTYFVGILSNALDLTAGITDVPLFKV